MSKYDREIVGKDGIKTTVDVYDVLLAFDVKNPALQHLIKKALCVGIRGHKNSDTDLQDIIDSSIRAKQIHEDNPMKNIKDKPFVRGFEPEV